MKFLFTILITFYSLFGLSQYKFHNYEETYKTISEMLRGEIKLDFQKVVFLTEQAYWDNKLDEKAFNSEVSRLAQLAQVHALANSENLIYEANDKDTLLLWASIFKVMTDSIPIVVIGQSDTVFHQPYQYDFNDIAGSNNWENMFVSKLMATHKGNCHSLPYLYKMIADKLGVSAHLALAPNHLYIKHQSKALGVYNTELTSGSFPIDAWLMSSGYIHLDAIRSGIYMERLSEKQSLALCLVDLAKGFQRKYGSQYNDFIAKCLDTALQYFPHCINAMLFQSELLKQQYEISKGQKKAELFYQYEHLIVNIHRLGYRKMPEQTYLNWLIDLNENQEKYANKKISSIKP